MRPPEVRPPEVRVGLSGEGRRIALLVSGYHGEVCETLLASARRALEAHGVEPKGIDVLRVPGAFELTTAAGWAARSGRFDAVIGLGCVVKGETDHDVYINHAVAEGFTRVGESTGVPVILGLLTTNDVLQAERRADPRFGGGKGWECALAALEMIRVRQTIERGPERGADSGSAHASDSRTEQSADSGTERAADSGTERAADSRTEG